MIILAIVDRQNPPSIREVVGLNHTQHTQRVLGLDQLDTNCSTSHEQPWRRSWEASYSSKHQK